MHRMFIILLRFLSLKLYYQQKDRDKCHPGHSVFLSHKTTVVIMHPFVLFQIVVFAVFVAGRILPDGWQLLALVQ